jgi:hypothetical protein
MRACNWPRIQLPRPQNLQDALGLVPRIQNDRLARLGIAQDGAGALQHPLRTHVVNRFFAHSESIATRSEVSPFPVGAALISSWSGTRVGLDSWKRVVSGVLRLELH